MPKKAASRARKTAPSPSIDRLKNQLAAARKTIANLKLRADTDGLLDILNRRGFERELRRSIAYIKRYRAGAAIVFLDVDGLKPINDRHGHAAGDAVLTAVARTLTANVRLSDIVARLGGDEFGILLWNLDHADAIKKVRALEQAVDGIELTHRGGTLHFGASAGMTMLDGDDEPADVLRRADQAMYERKRDRRKRTARARPSAPAPVRR